MKLKRLFGILIALCLALGVTALGVSATEAASGGIIQPEVMPIEDLEKIEPFISTYSMFGSPEYSTSVDELAEILREGMKQREPSILVHYQVSMDEFEYTQESMHALFMEIFEKAIAHTGVPDEGDYLHKHYGGMSGSYTGSAYDGEYFLTIE